MTGDLERARSVAVTLEQMVAEALRLHQVFRVCWDCWDCDGECKPDHEVTLVCRECCAPGDHHSEACADGWGWHGQRAGDCWPCPTAQALGVEP